MAGSVQIDGLKELIRAVNKLDKASGRELNKELKDTVGKEFVEDVRSRLGGVGFKHSSGRLAGTIKASARGGSLFVRSSPALKPGPKSRMGYAAVYEYGYGKRFASLNPTADAWDSTGKLERELDGYLDWIEREFRA